MTAPLPQDTFSTRHDVLKLEIVRMANEARVPIDCEVFGIFRTLIPTQELEEGGSLSRSRQRNGLCPDFKIRVPTGDGPRDQLGELKCLSAGVSRYPVGRAEKQVDRRARELPGSYRRPLEKLDRQMGTPVGETGRLVAKLQSFGTLLGFVSGAWAEGSRDLHAFIQTCAESRVAFLTRSTGRPASDNMLGSIVSSYRRLLSTTAVRNQAICLINRVGLIAPEAREAAGRRCLAMKRDEDLRMERRTQWQSTLSLPGNARRGQCHRTH